ncbi:MAG: cytochrome c [Thiomonas sp.]|nr:cytochrome c [Thiomonas sp.]
MTPTMHLIRRIASTGALLGLLGLAGLPGLPGLPLARAADTAPHEFQGANRVKGQQYYTDLKCAACHAERMMGSASAMYTRPDRKVHNPKQLLAFTQMCVTQLNHDLFPEEVKDIAAYLNQTYYKFK